MQIQTEAIWIQNPWKRTPIAINKSSDCKSTHIIGLRVALEVEESIVICHRHREYFTQRSTPKECFGWPTYEGRGWSLLQRWSVRQWVSVCPLINGLPWLEVSTEQTSPVREDWMRRHPPRYPIDQNDPWYWLSPRGSGSVNLEGFEFSNAHHYAANYALQLRAPSPDLASYPRRLALAAQHCLQNDAEWASQVKCAKAAVLALSHACPDSERMYWQTLLDAKI